MHAPEAKTLLKHSPSHACQLLLLLDHVLLAVYYQVCHVKRLSFDAI
jgi:hypothetical protein